MRPCSTSPACARPAAALPDSRPPCDYMPSSASLPQGAGPSISTENRDRRQGKTFRTPCADAPAQRRESAPSSRSPASVGLVHHDAAQPGRVQDADMLLLHRDQALGLEAREEPAHRLEREPEIASDLVARHAQVELVGGVAACEE